ncbi:hypothetical protein RRG08_059932 [Elysia crispata]|uniref:Uncharacterized protein n=1 Tax=Elysia crispata TaxID=231223 RepID=A0AAE1CTP3_9GAST|nr:hypothetical protein RRG08_059932 [Elysia crispata]
MYATHVHARLVSHCATGGVLSQLTSSPTTTRLWEIRDSLGTPLLQQQLLLQLLSHAHSSLVSVNLVSANSSPLGDT